MKVICFIKHWPCTPESASACPPPREWSRAAQTRLVSADMPEGDTHHTHSDCETHSFTAHLLHRASAHLSVSGRHKLEDDMFEILKVDFSRVIEVWCVGYGGVGCRGAWGKCWRGLRTNPLLLFCPALRQLLLHLSFWLWLQLLQRSEKGKEHKFFFWTYIEPCTMSTNISSFSTSEEKKVSICFCPFIILTDQPPW